VLLTIHSEEYEELFMKKKIISIFYAFLATLLITTSAGAGGSVKLSSATFSLGSLIADGMLSRLGRTDVTVVLIGTGPSDITCTNPGSNDVPGQSYPKVSAYGEQLLKGNDPLRKNGWSPFEVETEDPQISWIEGGCPGENWSARIDFTYYSEATIRVYETSTGSLLLEQRYTCITARYPSPTVSCTPTA
jgi:hypothetical protein